MKRSLRLPVFSGAAGGRLFALGLGGAVAGLPGMLLACPLCSTDTGQQVRAGIFDEHFWSTLAAVVSPFPILLLDIAIFHFGLPEILALFPAANFMDELISGTAPDPDP